MNYKLIIQILTPNTNKIEENYLANVIYREDKKPDKIDLPEETKNSPLFLYFENRMNTMDADHKKEMEKNKKKHDNGMKELKLKFQILEKILSKKFTEETKH
jgi:hypothetical protein